MTLAVVMHQPLKTKHVICWIAQLPLSPHPSISPLFIQCFPFAIYRTRECIEPARCYDGAGCGDEPVFEDEPCDLLDCPTTSQAPPTTPPPPPTPEPPMRMLILLLFILYFIYFVEKEVMLSFHNKLSSQVAQN